MTFLRKLMVLPFEVLIAGFVVVSGALALLHIGGIGQDALSVQLPSWLAHTTNALYVLSGLAIVSGIGFARGDYEAAGLVGIASGAVIRGLALVWFVGWIAPIVVTLVFDAMIVAACGTRLVHIVGHKTVVLAELVERPDRRASQR